MRALEEILTKLKANASLMGSRPQSEAEITKSLKLSGMFKAAKAEYDRAVEDHRKLEKQLNEAEESGVCPTCGQKSNKAVKQAKIMLEQAKIDAGIALIKNVESRQAYEYEASKLECVTKAQNKWDAQKAELNDALDEHAMRKQRFDANKEAREASEKLEALKSDGTQLATRLEGVKIQLSVALALRESSLFERNRLLTQRTAAATRAKAVAEAGRAQVEASILKQVCEMLTELREKMIAEAIGPVVAKANELCRPILGREIKFEDGEIILDRHSHKTASDSAKLLIYAALSIALASETSEKVCTIGRFESLDHTRQRLFVQLALDLVTAGKIKQFLIIGVGTRSEEWTQLYPEERNLSITRL